MENETQTLEETTSSGETEPTERNSSNLAVAITIVALLVWFGFQTFQLAGERSNLTAVKANQELPMQESHKVRAQFESLMKKTNELANQGNAGAKLVIDELKKRGMAVQPSAKPDK